MKLMIVDDEPDVLRVLKTYLESLGYEVLPSPTAANPPSEWTARIRLGFRGCMHAPPGRTGVGTSNPQFEV
jgi:hypothetical protein